MEPDWQEVEEAVRRAEAYGTVGVALEGPEGRRWLIAAIAASRPRAW